MKSEGRRHFGIVNGWCDYGRMWEEISRTPSPRRKSLENEPLSIMTIESIYNNSIQQQLYSLCSLAIDSVVTQAEIGASLLSLLKLY